MNPPSFYVNRLKFLKFIWTDDRRRRTHGGGVWKGFRTPLASPCWVRRLAGWYMTYISCQLMLFLFGHLCGSWLVWQTSADSVLQHFRAPALFTSDSCWHATVTFEYSVDAPFCLPCYIQLTWNSDWSLTKFFIRNCGFTMETCTIILDSHLF